MAAKSKLLSGSIWHTERKYQKKNTDPYMDPGHLDAAECQCRHAGSWWAQLTVAREVGLEKEKHIRDRSGWNPNNHDLVGVSLNWRQEMNKNITLRLGKLLMFSEANTKSPQGMWDPGEELLQKVNACLKTTMHKNKNHHDSRQNK